MKKSLVFIFLGALLTGSAQLTAAFEAPKPTKVTNTGLTNIAVYFGANFCGGPLSDVCKREILKPGESTTYKWKWGQTDREVAINQPSRVWRRRLGGVQLPTIAQRFRGPYLDKEIKFESRQSKQLREKKKLQEKVLTTQQELEAARGELELLKKGKIEN